VVKGEQKQSKHHCCSAEIMEFKRTYKNPYHNVANSLDKFVLLIGIIANDDDEAGFCDPSLIRGRYR